MKEDLVLLKSILESCDVSDMPSDVTIKNIAELEEYYCPQDLVKIYNYCLENITNMGLLSQVIRLADSHRNIITLRNLISLLKTGFDDCDGSDDIDSLINLRVLCAKAISNYKDTSTVTVLLDCMNNKSEHYKVRLACADALGRIGDRFAVSSLIDVLEDEEEKSIYLKESATFALGLLGDLRAVDPLISILESKQGFLDKFSFLKEKIVEALGKLNINNTKVLNALKNSLMDSSPLVRINAIEAIMNSGEENSTDLIRQCLIDEDNEVKKNALIALYNLLGKDILLEIISLPSYSDFLKKEAKLLLEEYEEDYE